MTQTQDEGKFHGINGTGFHLSLCDDTAECPNCKKRARLTETILQRSSNNKKGWVTVRCCHCQEKLGATTDMKGDAVLFTLSENETK